MTAYDYQVLAFHDAAPLKSVGFYSSSPLTLDVHGSGFDGVSIVLINGVESPEFVVVSPRRILAQVPTSELKSTLRTVRVLLAKSGLTKKSIVGITSLVHGARASGFTKLLQSYLRLLFTNRGEDLVHPELGGGLYKLVGSAGSTSELRAAATRAVSLTEQQLVQLQARNAVLTDSERLRSATLLSADYDQATTSLGIRLGLTAMDGTTGNPHLSV